MEKRRPGLSLGTVAGAALFVAVLLCVAAGSGDRGSAVELISAAVLSGVASLLLIMRRRLNALARSMAATAQNDFSHRARRHPVREIDALGMAYNAMAGGLGETTARLERLALQDPLTGLPNRAAFMSRFSAAFSQSTTRNSELAVLFMDVDRFKLVNDTLGHGMGDQLLAVVSKRLLSAVDEGVVARIGGDEFTILVAGKDAERRAIEAAERIHDVLQWPVSVGRDEVFTSMSIGVAARTADDRGITDLLRKADVALYRAKAEGRGRFAVYRPEHDQLSSEQFDLDNALRWAIERGELLLQFQPIVDLASGTIAGAEALLRWNHPHRGVLSPGMFISLAEETGQIVKIGQWVLAEACRWGVEFQRRRPGHPFVVAVNISADEFRQPGFADALVRILEETGMVPSRLKLEVTESVLIGDTTAITGLLAELRGLGVGLSIDDFGTGYSSLSYLQRLPVDTLKIDQSFVRSLATDASAGPVLRAIAQLGNALFMQVVAEGIETAQQLEFVAGVGCQFGQGYYFSRPMAPEVFTKLLTAEEEAPLIAIRAAEREEALAELRRAG